MPGGKAFWGYHADLYANGQIKASVVIGASIYATYSSALHSELRSGQVGPNMSGYSRIQTFPNRDEEYLGERSAHR